MQIQRTDFCCLCKACTAENTADKYTKNTFTSNSVTLSKLKIERIFTYSYVNIYNHSPKTITIILSPVMASACKPLALSIILGPHPVVHSPKYNT